MTHYQIILFVLLLLHPSTCIWKCNKRQGPTEAPHNSELQSACSYSCPFYPTLHVIAIFVNNGSTSESRTLEVGHGTEMLVPHKEESSVLKSELDNKVKWKWGKPITITTFQARHVVINVPPASASIVYQEEASCFSKFVSTTAVVRVWGNTLQANATLNFTCSDTIHHTNSQFVPLTGPFEVDDGIEAAVAYSISTPYDGTDTKQLLELVNSELSKFSPSRTTGIDWRKHLLTQFGSVEREYTLHVPEGRRGSLHFITADCGDLAFQGIWFPVYYKLEDGGNWCESPEHPVCLQIPQSSVDQCIPGTKTRLQHTCQPRITTLDMALRKGSCSREWVKVVDGEIGLGVKGPGADRVDEEFGQQFTVKLESELPLFNSFPPNPDWSPYGVKKGILIPTLSESSTKPMLQLVIRCGFYELYTSQLEIDE